MFGRFEQQFGIDLGTCNTVIYQKGRGIVLEEPSVIAIWKDTREIEAYGAQAKAMIGKTSANLEVFYPLKDGVIANFELTLAMLKYYIDSVKGKSTWFGTPQVLISVPCGINNMQKREIERMILNKDARKAVAIAEPLAAALGEGLPVYDSTACMVLDIGGGVSEAALISLGRVVSSLSIPLGGMAIDREIMELVKRNHSLIIGEQTAEDYKIKAARAMKLHKEERVEIRGRDYAGGLPKEIVISTDELGELFDHFNQVIVDFTRAAIDKFPTEQIGDVSERGILLCGGGSLLPGLDRRLQNEMGVPLHLAESPMGCAALGIGKLLINDPVKIDLPFHFSIKRHFPNWLRFSEENESVGVN
jgi:rod shape-determining protein MreB